MKRQLYFNTLVAALGGFLFGYDTAVISGAIPSLRAFFGLSDMMLGWAVSTALIGCVLGAFLTAKPADRFGRKKVLITIALIYFVSAVGSSLAGNFSLFVLFRFIGGMAVGSSSVIAPLFISEIAPPSIRGKLAMSFQFLLVVGILCAFFVNYFIASHLGHSWRWMLMAEAIPALIFIILSLFLENSPRWLVMRKRFREAEQVIGKMDTSVQAVTVIEEIKSSLGEGTSVEKVSLFKKPQLKLIVIGFLVGMFNQLTGINIIMYYAPSILRSAGFSMDSSLIQTVIIGATNLTFTIVAMVIIDRIGRKFLLLLGSAGMSVFLGLFAYAYMHQGEERYLMLVSLVGFIMFFAISQGAVIWVLLAEMFPNTIRARGSSIGSFSHWLFNFIITLTFPVVSTSIGTGSVFLIFTAGTVVSFLFYKHYIVETKGKALEKMG